MTSTLFIELEQVESTNNYATGLLHEGVAQAGTAVFAHHQTAGKGQRNKQWLGEAGQNIALSIIYRPASVSVSQTFGLSKAVAVATHRFLTKYMGDEVRIKWPNDLYWRDRKTAGILIENNLQGSRWNWSVCGIGVNVNQTVFEPLTVTPVSIKQVSGKHHPPLLLAKELYGFVNEAYDQLQTAPALIEKAYQANLYKAGERVTLKKGSRVFTGTIEGVTPQGELVVLTAVEEHFAVGEVEWVI